MNICGGPIMTWMVLYGFILMVSSSCAGEEQCAPSHLRTEYVENPLGIDTTVPRFSWWMEHAEPNQMQTAYEIIVVEEGHQEHWADPVWTTGKVTSDKNVHIPYAGLPLRSCTRYFWKVRTWDSQDRPSAWSDAAWFETALLTPEDFQAKWIRGPEDIPEQEEGGTKRPAVRHSPLLRKEFVLRDPIKRARAYVSAMGYYELYINGRRVGDHVLDPGNTERTKRVLYSIYDATEFVRPGANACGLMLGHGWHSGTCAGWLQLRVEYDDGTTETIITDESWVASVDGPIREESLYHGETYDARKEIPGWATPGFDTKNWTPVAIYEFPPPKLTAQIMPPIRVVQRIRPVNITRLDPETQIVDFGQNLSGWVRFTVEGNSGHEIVIRHAEVLYPDGRLNPSNLRSARATDRYILKGGGKEEYAPRFTQHGFRYAEFRNYPRDLTTEDLVAEVVHTDLPRIGSFVTTSPFLNNLRDIMIWSIRGNSMSHPTDCPQRDERMGWMGDAHLAAESTLLNFDAIAYYENWLRTMADSQDEAGHIPDTVPHIWGEKDGSPPWAIAYPIITWYLYRYAGDVRVVEEHYENIKRWFGTLEQKAHNYIVESCRYGDWVGLEPTPEPLISTGCYYWTARILEEFAALLGKVDERTRFATRAEEIAAAFRKTFWDEKNGYFGNGSQFSQIFPIYLGIATDEQKEKAFQHLVREIEERRKGHLATGILGTKYLFPVLANSGRIDLAFRLLFNQDYPSWGYMINHGATTTWELWELETDTKMNSHNHQMFGGILWWMIDAIGGISTVPAPAFMPLRIAPHIPENLGGAETVVNTVRGKVACSWRRDEDRFWMKVIIPPNTTAEVTVPKFKPDGQMKMNGADLPRACMEDTSTLTLRLGSGTYIFTVN